MKKKSDAPSAPEMPAWHPNFRNYDKLPDVKVVRTTFFVNGAAILVASALLIFFGFQEWKLRAVRVQIADWQRQIDTNKKNSDQARLLFAKFKTEESRINEVDAFVKSKPLLSELILRLSETLPANIAIDQLDLRENGLAMRFSVRGTAQDASGLATAYSEQLKADKVLSARFEDVSFTSTPTRNPSTGRIVVEFFLRLKGAKK
ncbi:MAG: hypothetical protein ABIZ49_10930 [Opitutaceae bacterium]